MKIDTNWHILVVDDMEPMQKIVQGLLKQLGLVKTTTAPNGKAAWHVLNKEHIDFIVCDINMPVMNGLEFLEKVRADERFAKIPFLMVTAEADKDTVAKAVQLGVNSYILKPLTPVTFEKKLTEMFG